jgi:hypothetical protein
MELNSLINVRRLADLLRTRVNSHEGLAVLGRVLNRFRCPGFVQQTAYTYRTSKGVQVEVAVLTASRYTVVTINGINVYFDRLTGVIDRARTVGPSEEMVLRKRVVDRFPGTRGRQR